VELAFLVTWDLKVRGFWGEAMKIGLLQAFRGKEVKSGQGPGKSPEKAKRNLKGSKGRKRGKKSCGVSGVLACR